MSRVASGWSPFTVAIRHADQEGECGDEVLLQQVDGYHHDIATQHGPEPITLQMAVEGEATS